MSSSSRVLGAVSTLVLAFAVAACGGSGSSGSTPASAASIPTAAPASSGAAAPGAAKVSANDASEDAITEALRAAGVRSPERWAEEVVEYRPYPTGDPNLTKLRQNLAKYNPGQETTDRIVSALTP